MSTIAKTSIRKNKHFILDQTRLNRAQKALKTRTETETVERALENAIIETERNTIAWAAHDEFVAQMIKGGFQIDDVYGRLEDK